MGNKKILLINDISGYGRVATTAMMPILSYMGHPTCNLPTALVSNTFSHGQCHVMDTTEYLSGVFPVWKQLGFEFDAIATGLIMSQRQAQLITSFCQQAADKGTQIFVDPIMGDHGRLYNGLSSAVVDFMREMVAVADLTYPNYTEACLLTHSDYHPEGLDTDDIHLLTDSLKAICRGSVIITSVPTHGGHCVAGYDENNGQYFLLPYDEIPVHLPGTGDIFSAVLIGHLLNGISLSTAIRSAMDTVYRLIDLNKDNADKTFGIPIENYLNIISAIN